MDVAFWSDVEVVKFRTEEEGTTERIFISCALIELNFVNGISLVRCLKSTFCMTISSNNVCINMEQMLLGYSVIT